MKTIKYLPLLAGIIMAVVVAPSPARATVVISFMGIKLCITGKKNPDGCKNLISNPNVTTVLVDQAAMKKIDASQGKSVRVESIKKKSATHALTGNRIRR